MFRETNFQLSSFFFVSYFAFGSFAPLLGIYLEKNLQFTGTQIGVILSISPLVMVICLPLWGIFTDYIQKPNQILIINLIFSGLIGCIFLFIQSYFWVILCSIFLSIFNCTIVPVSDSITLRYVEKHHLDYAQFRLWGSAGFAIAAWIMSKISDSHNLIIIFISFSLCMFASAYIAWNLPNTTISLHSNIKQGLRKLIHYPQIFLLFIAVFLIFGPLQAYNSLFGLFFQTIGGSLSGVGITFLIGSGIQVFFMRFTNLFIRKYGFIFVTILASLLSGFRWILFAFPTTVLMAYLLTIVQGFAIAMLAPAFLQFIHDQTPAEIKNTAISLLTVVGQGLGSSFFIYIGGWLIDVSSIFMTNLFYGISSFIGILFLFITRNPKLI